MSQPDPLNPLARTIQPAAEVPYDMVDAALQDESGKLLKSAEVMKAMQLPQVRGYLTEALDRAGATMESSAKVIAEAQGAERITPGFDKGSLVDEHRQPDHKTRLFAAELNLKARGELKDRDAINIFQNLTDEQVAKIAAGELDPGSLLMLTPRAAGLVNTPQDADPLAPEQP